MAKRDREDIPQTAGEITASWFNKILSGQVDGAKVTGVTTKVIGLGIGFVGELHRCTLEWDREGAELPQSLIVKVPSHVGVNRALGEGLFAYEREIRMYREFGGQLGVRMPKHWYSAMDPDPAPWLSKVIVFLFERLPLGAISWIIDRFLKFAEKGPRRYVLVIEDIQDAQNPTQVDGGSIADARVALEILAEFHATNWRAERAIGADDYLWPLNRTPKVVQASYRRNRDPFVEQFGSSVPTHVLARIDALQDRIPEVMDDLTAEPRALLHGDYRLDNLLFRPGGDVVVVDYQLICYGRPGWDVAYFITTALSAEHRDQEASLLHTYHDALVSHGVTDYSFDQLNRDVTLTKDLLAHRMIGTGELIQTDLQDRDDTFLEVATTRILGWVDQ